MTYIRRIETDGRTMRDIGFIIQPGHQMMSLALLSVFDFANRAGGHKAYRVFLKSEGGGPVASSWGTLTHTEALDEVQAFDTLIVAGNPDQRGGTPTLAAYLRTAASKVRRVAAPCTAAFTLAAAGLLDGRRATTHWRHASDLQALHPRVRVEEDRIYIVDGPIWTSAGMTAGIDLALAMVEEDLGSDVAREVARNLVVYHRRAGGQSQFSTLIDLAPTSDRIRAALDHARQNLTQHLSVDDLATVARLSPRQFSRAFRAETRETPARAVERLRVEAARTMIETGRLSADEVARATGLGDRGRMRRAFMRHLGQPPQSVRRHARA